jgi:Nucleotidyl transferase AbiEii toxin, Type IV TA system
MKPLIDLRHLNDARIRQQAGDLKVSDAQLVENCLHAFLLLGHLSSSGLPFLFKGGTSILLHVPVLRRLSIDIDIVSPVAEENLVAHLREIAKLPPFTRLDEDERGFRGQPNRRHFRFFYPCILRPGQERNVLMDVVEGSWDYLQHEKKPIAQPWMDISESAEVLVPTVPALLADKLTAFAPNTIGVQYVNSKGRDGDLMQIGKQLFDVGELFDHCQNLQACYDPYQASFAVENGYRDGKFTIKETLEDTLTAALHASFRNPQNPEHHDRLIRRCVRPLQGHLAGCSFGTPEAAIAAGKVAVLVELLKRGRKPNPCHPNRSNHPATSRTSRASPSKVSGHS